jgi:hypothetical protein
MQMASFFNHSEVKISSSRRVKGITGK